MHLISTLIILGLGFSQCFIVGEHRDVPGSERIVSKNYDLRLSEEWIEQPLDHFNSNNETWKMRYFKTLTYWKPNGPIYLYIGGEGPVATSEQSERDCGILCQLVNETNGAIFLSEHRYYGKSMPVEIKDASSMKYLSSKQALADVAILIKLIKSAPEFKSSKVVVIGGSYAGNLAAWMRALYPDLVDAALSSSAPVLAKKDFYEYDETVSDTYEKYGSTDCLNKIKTLFNHYAELLKTTSGIEELKRDLNICNESDMTNADNQAQLFFEGISEYMTNSQYGSPDDIKVHCQFIHTNNWAISMRRSIEFYEKLSSQSRTSTGNKLFQLIKWARLTPRFNDCHDVNFTKTIEDTKANKNDWLNLYSWTYQKCTEFGYFKTTTSKKQPFCTLVPLDFFIKRCKGIYGEDFNEKRVDDGVAQANALYGGLTPNVTNVVFTHGDMDPWHRLGVLKDLSETVVVRITNETSHCALLNDPKPYDPSALVKDREYVKTMIKKWINNVS